MASLNQGSENGIRFAYWVPNVSGGLVISKIEQRTSWELDYNVELARLAEKNGFDYALSQIRFTAGYGAEFQHEPVAFTHALLAATEKLHVIAALLPGPWNPALAAKQLATIDVLTKGRLAVNVVSGWFMGEFQCDWRTLGWSTTSATAVRRNSSARLKGIWSEDSFTFQGGTSTVSTSIQLEARSQLKSHIRRSSKAAARVQRETWPRESPIGTSPTATR